MYVDFTKERKSIRRSIIISWVINVLVISLVFTASGALFWLRPDMSNEDVYATLLVLFVSGVVISLVVLSVVSLKSSAILSSVTPDMIPVPQGSMIHNIVEEMSVSSGVPMPDVYISPIEAPNAWVIGNKKKSILVVTEGLMNVLNREELQGVIGHEIGHLKSGDSNDMTKLIVLAGIGSFVTHIALRMLYYTVGGRRSDSDNKNPLVAIVMLVSLVFLIVAPLASALCRASMSRKRETQADTLSVQYTRNPTSLARALSKIESAYGEVKDPEERPRAVESMAFFNPARLFSTHPPTEKRIAALKKMGAVVV